MFGLLQTHRLIFEERREIEGGVSSLVFRPEEPFVRRAGQHGILGLGTFTMKPFSLASAPEEERVLIGTSLASGSAFKQRLAALRSGEAVTLRGPVNNFTLDGSERQVILLAQGVGITPLRSILAHIMLQKLTVESTLIHVANAGHAYRHDTEGWATKAAYPEHADDFRALVKRASIDYDEGTFFVAGASSFVSDSAALLREAGVDRRNIRQDKYLGYRPQVRVSSEADEGNADSLRLATVKGAGQ